MTDQAKPTRKQPKVYNFFWVSAENSEPYTVCSMDRISINQNQLADVIIIYPSLLTPGVYVKNGDDKSPVIELILAVQKGHSLLGEADVLNQLMVTEDLDLERHYLKTDRSKSLSVSIEGPLTHKSDRIFYKTSMIKGVLKLQDSFKDRALYIVKVSFKFLEQVTPRGTSALRPGQGEEDSNLRNFLTGMRKPYGTPQCGPRKIVRYHPVFIYDSLEEYSIAHITDIHINSRQDSLKHSSARVIEDEQAKSDSPFISDLMNINKLTFINIINRAARKADILLLGGDYVDHHENIGPKFTFDSSKKVNPDIIWRLVDCSPSAKNTYYQRDKFIDNEILYGIIIDVINKYKCPIFGILGNHDAYQKPFGISPRPLGTKKVNEGIPADNNLTFHEAMLLFGPSFGTVYETDQLGLSLGLEEPELFSWYYAVLSPFSEYCVNLPKHTLVCVGWGDGEDKLMCLNDMSQGFGHLPRDDRRQVRYRMPPQLVEQTVDPQLALVAEALASGKKIILLSHHTFFSYREDMPLTEIQSAQAATVELNKKYSEHTMGTCNDTQRAVKFFQIANNASCFACILSGHSHRRGVYFMSMPPGAPPEYNSYEHPGVEVQVAGAKISQALSPYPPPALGANALPLPFIVSDSAGPIPRWNDGTNEFKNWGSDRPSGTHIKFNADGSLGIVEPIFTSNPMAKPRIAVAVDFLHNYERDTLLPDWDHISIFKPIYRDMGIFTKFNIIRRPSQWVSKEYWIMTQTIDLPVYIECIKFYAADMRQGDRAEWLRVKVENSDSCNLAEGYEYSRQEILRFYQKGKPSLNARVFAVSQESISQLQQLIGGNQLSIFASIKFSSSDQRVLARYNLKDRWNIQVSISKGDSENIFRVHKPGHGHREGPDFAAYRYLSKYQNPV